LIGKGMSPTTLESLFIPMILDPLPPPTEFIGEQCEICTFGQDAEKLLLCNGVVDGRECTKGSHLYCLIPPLMNTPEGDWYCQGCRKVIFDKIKNHIGIIAAQNVINLHNGTTHISTDLEEFPEYARLELHALFPEQKLSCPFLYVEENPMYNNTLAIKQRLHQFLTSSKN